jgi:uncharacterized membrane protein YfcA
MLDFAGTFSLAEATLILVSLFMGGILKGVTGAGAPIIAIPVMAAVTDLPTAVMVMLIPNFLTNIRQAWQFRSQQPDKRFLWPYLAAGAVGVLIGTALLTGLPSRGLDLLIAGAVLLYVAFRLIQPDWAIGGGLARTLAIPAGITAGVLQGATGLSAPATLGFLGAVRFSRPTFVATVALLFLIFSAVHIGVLGVFGVFTPLLAAASLVALMPILLGMEVGSRLSDHIPQVIFDRLVLGLLVAIAIKTLFG